MSTVELSVASESLADVLHRLGDLPPERLRIPPAFGLATEADVLKAHESPRKYLCELIDGFLVEKAMGSKESLLAVYLAHLLWNYLETQNDLGIVLGSDGMLRFAPGLIYIPDVSFISCESLPDGKLPDEAIASVVPDLAVEVLSPSNTQREIENKIHNYLHYGVRMVWVIDPHDRTALVFRDPNNPQKLCDTDDLQGEDVLPGFAVPLAQLLAKANF